MRAGDFLYAAGDPGLIRDFAPGAAGATSVTKLDADSGKKVIVSRQLISPEGLFALIKQDMLNLDAKGKMGSSATARFNDAMFTESR